MNRLKTITLAVPLLAPLAGWSAADGLPVSPPVPGLAASQHYEVCVRSASDGRAWESAFAWETVCTSIGKKTNAYFDTLAGWTHRYVNFETAGAVEIEIARVNGQPQPHLREPHACWIARLEVYERIDQQPWNQP